MDPPFPKNKLSDPTHLADDHRIMFLSKEVPVETEQHGTLLAHYIVAIGPADDSREFSANDLEENLQEMHDQAVAAGVTSFDGYLYAIGEESGDITRFWFYPGNNELHQEAAILSWPDGTPVPKEVYEL
jgi:hypothetical protein